MLLLLLLQAYSTSVQWLLLSLLAQLGLRPVPDFPGYPGFMPCDSASQQDQPRDAKCPGFQGMLVTKRR